MKTRKEVLITAAEAALRGACYSTLEAGGLSNTADELFEEVSKKYRRPDSRYYNIRSLYCCFLAAADKDLS